MLSFRKQLRNGKYSRYTKRKISVYRIICNIIRFFRIIKTKQTSMHGKISLIFQFSDFKINF